MLELQQGHMLLAITTLKKVGAYLLIIAWGIVISVDETSIPWPCHLKGSTFCEE